MVYQVPGRYHGCFDDVGEISWCLLDSGLGTGIVCRSTMVHVAGPG